MDVTFHSVSVCDSLANEVSTRTAREPLRGTGLVSSMGGIRMGSTENVQVLISQSLRSRFMATFALCAIAEDDVHTGRLERTIHTVKAIRRMLSDINVLVCGPDRLYAGTLHEAAEMLAELENRTQAIEQAIGPPHRFH